MEISDLSPEQRAKAMACESAEELVKLADEYGVCLSDEQLEAITGGVNWTGCSNYTTNCTKDFVW